MKYKEENAFRLPWLGLLIALSTVGIDQLSKWIMLVQVGIDTRPPIPVNAFLSLVMVWNRGVSFGLFSSAELSQRLMLIAVALIIIAVMVRWLLRVESLWLARAIGLVIGGAASNIIDRILHGAVADFFYFHLGDYSWPAFNVADAAICVGVALLCLESMLGGNKKQAETV